MQKYFLQTTHNSCALTIITSGENLPVTLSERMRDVMICPNGLKSASKSSWLIVFARPLTYKFAPLIDSLLGRANDT